MNFWSSKIALITGGGGGIGRMTALLAARRGASVVVVDSNGAAAEETAALVGAERALAIRADVTSERDIADAVDQALARFGRIDILHNNASILRRHERIEDVPVEEFRQVLEINAVGMFLAARAVTPVMKSNGAGVIVNMSSRGGARGQAHILAYSVAKAGILAFTRGLAEQLAPWNIRVNALIPGLVETGMTQGGPNLEKARQSASYVFTPQEMARAVAFAAEREDMSGVVLEYIGTATGPELRLLGDFEYRTLDVGFGGADDAEAA